MKILFLDWNSYGNIDIIQAFSKVAEVLEYPFDKNAGYEDDGFEQTFYDALKKESPDFVFSFHYFAMISNICNRAGVKYASWVYDSPAVSLFSYTLINKCNYVFVFDSQMYELFASQGIKTVYYLPMASAVTRYDRINKEGYIHDVSFVGQLYTGKHSFYDRIEDQLSDYSRGYLRGLMRAQMEIDGFNFIEESLQPDVLKDMVDALELKPNHDGVESYEYLYSNYVINRKITSIERTEIISEIGGKYGIDLYTSDMSFAKEGVINHGKIDYYTEMPEVFTKSKINLNITLRSIQKGIPLRNMDILGCGGFLLTNYQEDMLRFFVPDEDFVYYESRKDMLDKIGYYLEHDEERCAIAKSGYEKVRDHHTYENRTDVIIDTVMNN